MAGRRRLDAELVHRQLVASRSVGRHAIASGRVTVDGRAVTKPSHPVGPDAQLRLTGPPLRYVSRAGLKLDHALDHFALDVQELTALDVGSSTGGFTDCLLQRGAAVVMAVDVGTGQLHPRLRADQRVVVREQTDVRHLDPATVPRPLGLVVADLSFISLRLVLPTLAALAGGAPLVALVKPQFEAGRADVARGKGVIDDPTIWRRVLAEVVESAAAHGLLLRAITPSPIRGARGNVEFATWLQPVANSLKPDDPTPLPVDAAALDEVVADAETSDL